MKLCKELLKIINKDFEIEQVKEHFLKCETCQNDLIKIIESYASNNPIFLLAKNLLKQKLNFNVK